MFTLVTGAKGGGGGGRGVNHVKKITAKNITLDDYFISVIIRV